MHSDTPSQAHATLQNIKAATLMNASALPHKEEGQQEWQGLGFSIGGARLVAQVGDVSELLMRPRVTKLPGVADWVLGVANVRGRLIPVIDLHRFLDLPSTVAAHQARVMIVEQDDLIAGLSVEQSLGIQHFAQDAYEPGVGSELPGIGRFVRGAFRAGGRVYHHIELRTILSDPEFFNVAKNQPEDGHVSNYWQSSNNEFDFD